MSLLRSHIYKFIVGVLIIFIISPIPTLFVTHKYSYITGFISIFHNFAQLSSMTIPKIDWMHESIFSQQMRWYILLINQHRYSLTCGNIFLSIVRFTFTLAIGFFISLGIGHLFFKAPQSVKSSLLY